MENNATISQQVITPFANVGKGILRNTKGDLGIWALAILLSLFSLVTVYSSTGTLAFKKFGGQTEVYLLKQTLFLLAGMAIMYCSHLIHYEWYKYVAKWLYWASIPLLLYTYFFGLKINDGTRWVSVLGITLQSSDVAKLGLFMYLSLKLSRLQDDTNSFWKGFWPLIKPIIIICILILPANFSTAVLLGVSAVFLLFIGRANGTFLLKFIGIASIPVIIVFGLAKYTYNNPDANLSNNLNKVARLGTWVSRVQLHFFAKEGETPDQVMQSNMAIAKGGLIGRGPGNSELKNFLPNAFSDFIYAIIIEEYGLLGAFIILAIYMAILYRCIRIFKTCNKSFGGFLVIGLSFMLTIQALSNMAVAVGLFPVTGVSLPLISMGGTSLIFTSFALGIILSVSRHTEINNNEKILEAA